MSDYGRYDDDTRSMSRSRGETRGYSRNSDSIFGFGGRDGRSERSVRTGGWAGTDRTSAYGEDDDRGGRWTSERENLGRDRHRERGYAGGSDRYRDNRGESFGRDDYRTGLPIDETGRLIASNKVEGTAVYGSDGGRLGSIYNFMVNKFSGRVEYAVMGYGGFLGMGMRYYPLPWQTLTYDTERGGYRIAMAERDLRDAPSFDRDTEPEFNRDYGERVHSWYGLNY
jgi:hypothetical protein